MIKNHLTVHHIHICWGFTFVLFSFTVVRLAVEAATVSSV